MLSYASLVTKPSVFKNFTGLTVEAFRQLLPDLRAAYLADLDKRDQEREVPRQRERGGGQKGVLQSMEDKLVFILFYFRQYPTQIVQGYLFGLGQPQANAWLHRLTPVLNAALGYSQQLPARKTRALKEVLAACPGLEFIIDGVERPIRRPKDKQEQKKKYSGKKKRHTVKNNVITDKRTGKVKGLSATVGGKKHDKKLADEQEIEFPEGSRLWKDNGYQGYEPEHVTTHQPKKKPPGRELTEAEREENRRISRERIGVEHSIGGVKVFNIAGHIFRNFKAGFDDLMMETACGLHNVRVDSRVPVASHRNENQITCAFGRARGRAR